VLQAGSIMKNGSLGSPKGRQGGRKEIALKDLKRGGGQGEEMKAKKTDRKERKKKGRVLRWTEERPSKPRKRVEEAGGSYPHALGGEKGKVWKIKC